MRAVCILKYKETDGNKNLTEAVIWKVPEDIKYPEGVRYRMAFVPQGHRTPAVLYDNHHPKGHHKHIRGKEFPYVFRGALELQQDFDTDILTWKKMEES